MTIHDPNFIEETITLPWTGVSNPQWTVNNTISTHNVPWTTVTPTFTEPSAKLQLNGKNADIEINGRSLCDAIDSIEKRLRILRPNPELEEQWEQLRELGDAYRKLEAELEEKQRMWEALQSNPPKETP